MPSRKQEKSTEKWGKWVGMILNGMGRKSLLNFLLEKKKNMRHRGVYCKVLW